MKRFAKQPAANGNPATFRDALLAKYPDAGRTKVVPSLQGLIVPVADLTPDPNNARVHPERNLEAVMESLAAFGQRKPIVVRAEGMVVMAGNGTLTAAKRLGWDGIAAAVSAMTDAEAAAYGVADNRTAELARWDHDVLRRLERLAADDGQAMPGWGLAELTILRAADGAKAVLDGDDWEELWEGMPEFVQDDLESDSRIVVHFRNQSDREHFLRLVGQERGDVRQNSIWHPKAEIDRMMDKRWETNGGGSR